MVRAVITYTERPVTLEEKAVAEVLTTVVAAAQKSDLALLESAFADDAKIAAIFEDTMLSKKESILRSRLIGVSVQLMILIQLPEPQVHRSIRLFQIF